VTSSITSAFTALRERRELALIPYLTAGYPTIPRFLEHLRTTADAGADMIEIGIPFCDPIADGPTIQHSTQVALAAGARLPAILDALGQAHRERPFRTPLIFMSYLNPLMAFGFDRFLLAMRQCGVTGLIPVDLPVEEAGEWLDAMRKHALDLVFLAAPTSTDARLREIAARSTGFIYAVSRTGTTGARGELHASLPAFLGRIRAQTGLPIAVGFGISAPQHVRALHDLADGVVVGSRIVDAIQRQEDVLALVRSLKDATRR
jgi:tryptophan synthase alpha subunit